MSDSEDSTGQVEVADGGRDEKRKQSKARRQV